MTSLILVIIAVVLLIISWARGSTMGTMVRIEAKTDLGQKQLVGYIQKALASPQDKLSELTQAAEEGVNVSQQNHQVIVDMIEPLRGEMAYQEMREHLVEYARTWRRLERGYLQLLKFTQGEQDSKENLVAWLEKDWKPTSV